MPQKHRQQADLRGVLVDPFGDLVGELVQSPALGRDQQLGFGLRAHGVCGRRPRPQNAPTASISAA